MDIETNLLLIQKILQDEKLFENIENIHNFKILKCEDYDDLNLYKCAKVLDSNIDAEKFIDNLSKINIRETLFDSYVKISKVKDYSENCWSEKTIFNDKDYNIQVIEKGDNYIKCYSHLELDDNTYQYNWVNNPFTLIQVDSCIKLFIAFEIDNMNQEELLQRFLDCLVKLENALK